MKSIKKKQAGTIDSHRFIGVCISCMYDFMSNIECYVAWAIQQGNYNLSKERHKNPGYDIIPRINDVLSMESTASFYIIG